MKTRKVDSSSLKTISHNKSTGEARVQFRSGARYVYEEVPADVVEKVVKAESVGSAFDKLVKKGGYNYREVK